MFEMYVQIFMLSCFVILGSGSHAIAASKASDVIIIANSGVTDASAKRIVRAVASETLKTITTKDPIIGNVPTLERLDDAALALPPKVVVEDAPGTKREPAAEVAHKKTAHGASAEPEVTAEKQSYGFKTATSVI
jgi:hypothetical protein